MKFTVFPENSIDLSKPKKVKFGIDPTFPRLHLGHFVPLRLLKTLKEQGHEVTLVLGTFTAQLGDPSGRDTTRPILSAKEVKENAQAIANQVRRILSTGYGVFMNHEIHEQCRLPDFLKTAAKFTLSFMTSRNGFAERIAKDQPIALHELLVPICQGLDSVQLETEIELGGQDQLFNFQIARQLQQDRGQKPQSCMMMPIINGTDGRKMSKSLGNCIFLDEAPEEMFGKIMSISDEVMREWLPLLTDIVDDVDHPMDSKKRLAASIVSQLHGDEAANSARQQFESKIQKGITPDEIPEISAETLVEAVAKLRNCSRTEARRLIDAGSVKLNDVKQSKDNSLQNGQILKVGSRFFGKISKLFQNSTS